MNDPAANLDRAASLEEQISFVLRTAATVHEEHGNEEVAAALRKQARLHSLRATWQRAAAAVQSAGSGNSKSLSDLQLDNAALSASFEVRSTPPPQVRLPNGGEGRMTKIDDLI